MRLLYIKCIFRTHIYIISLHSR